MAARAINRAVRDLAGQARSTRWCISVATNMIMIIGLPWVAMAGPMMTCCRFSNAAKIMSGALTPFMVRAGRFLFLINVGHKPAALPSLRRRQNCNCPSMRTSTVQRRTALVCIKSRKRVANAGPQRAHMSSLCGIAWKFSPVL